MAEQIGTVLLRRDTQGQNLSLVPFTTSPDVNGSIEDFEASREGSSPSGTAKGQAFRGSAISAPLAQLADANVSNTFQCGFESRGEYHPQYTKGRVSGFKNRKFLVRVQMH